MGYIRKRLERLLTPSGRRHKTATSNLSAKDCRTGEVSGFLQKGRFLFHQPIRTIPGGIELSRFCD
jgi:hypothetical protein